MPVQRIHTRWKMYLEDGFKLRKGKSGEQVFRKKGKEIRFAIWNEKFKTRNSLYRYYKRLVADEEPDVNKLERYDYSDSDIARVGYLVVEEMHGTFYRVVYGYSLIDEQVVLGAYCFEDSEDKEWALATWIDVVTY